MENNMTMTKVGDISWSDESLRLLPFVQLEYNRLKACGKFNIPGPKFPFINANAAAKIDNGGGDGDDDKNPCRFGTVSSWSFRNWSSSSSSSLQLLLCNDDSLK